jgi:hypothetical protein
MKDTGDAATQDPGLCHSVCTGAGYRRHKRIALSIEASSPLARRGLQALERQGIWLSAKILP